MMKDLIFGVANLVREEYQRASERFGPKNNSSHESYAVILEEVQEARLEIDTVEAKLQSYWMTVRGDDQEQQFRFLSDIREMAILGACELIQVAAMADKALKGYEEKEEQ